MYDASRIRKLMDRQGRTSRWLARETGYHYVTVSRVLTGQLPLSPAFAEAVANAFDVPLELLEAPATIESEVAA